TCVPRRAMPQPSQMSNLWRATASSRHSPGNPRGFTQHVTRGIALGGTEHLPTGGARGSSSVFRVVDYEAGLNSSEPFSGPPATSFVGYIGGRRSLRAIAPGQVASFRQAKDE